MGRTVRKGPNPKGPSLRHRRLVDFYFTPGISKWEACRLAGYANPANYSQDLFRHPDVVLLIKQKEQEMKEKAEVTREWIIQEYLKRAMADEVLSKYKKVSADGKTIEWDLTGATSEELALFNEIQQTRNGTKLGYVDSKAALDALAKLMGFVTEKQEVSGPNGGPVQMQLDDKELARRLAFVLNKGVQKEEA